MEKSLPITDTRIIYSSRYIYHHTVTDACSGMKIHKDFFEQVIFLYYVKCPSSSKNWNYLYCLALHGSYSKNKFHKCTLIFFHKFHLFIISNNIYYNNFSKSKLKLLTKYLESYLAIIIVKEFNIYKFQISFF